MYTIKNISNKVINIGTTALMPDQSMKASEAVCQTPAIKAFAKRRLVTLTAIVQDDPKIPEAATEPQAPAMNNDVVQEGTAGSAEEPDAPAEDDAPTEAPKPKGTRRTTKKAAEGTEQ